MIEKDLQIKISDYIDNSMSDKDRGEFEEFLLGDNELKCEIEELKMMVSDINMISKLKLDKSFDERLKQSINSYERKQSSSLSIFKLFDSPIYASVGAIAAVFLVVITTIVLKPYGGSEGQMMIRNETNFYNEDAIVEDDSIDLEEIDYEGEGHYKVNKNQNKILRVDDSSDN